MESAQEYRLSELMRNAQGGDRVAYERLLTEIAGLVRSFVRRRLRDPDTVEEVVQETLLSIHRYRHTYHPERPFGPWMYAIARHRTIDVGRRQRRRSENEVLAGAGLESLRSEAPPPRPAGLSPYLKRALALLPGRQREVIEMLKVEGHSIAEIAVRTGLSESGVKVAAHRGYKRLRLLLGRLDRDD